MWSTRIVEAVGRAGARAVGLVNDDELGIALEATELEESIPTAGAIVDVNGRRYDGVAVIERIGATHLPVIAVARHDDVSTRKRAIAAGATRVFSYEKFFRDGPALVATWLAGPARPPHGDVERTT